MDDIPFDPFELSAINAEAILNGGKKEYSLTPDQQMLGFLRLHDPVTTVSPSQNPVSVVEQDVVPSNGLVPDNSELSKSPSPENTSGGHASNACEGLLPAQQNSAALAASPHVTNKSGRDLKVSVAIRRCRTSTRTVPPPQKNPEIVPKVPEIQPAPPKQRQKTDPVQQKKLDTELRLNLKTITEEAGKGADDVKRQVENYADMSSKSLKDKLEFKNKAKLESGDKKTRRTALSNINQQVLRRKQYLSIHGLTVAMELLFVDKVNMHAERQSLIDKVESVEIEKQNLEAQVESLNAEVRRLRSQQGGSSPMGPPHDYPPSGGPSNDFGGDDSAPDDSNSGGPGSSSGSSAGPTLHEGPSYGGEPPYHSMSNALLPAEVPEDYSDYSSQESSSDEESNEGTGCGRRVDDELLIEHRSSDSRDMNQEDDLESALSWSSLSELDSGSECDTEPCSCAITDHPAVQTNAQETVGSDKLNHCSTPVNDVLPCKCQAVGKAQPHGFVSIDSCDDIPALVLPYSLSQTKVL